MKRFVTADPHFDHENIIKYCSRPFVSKEHMNNVLIKNWNEVVSSEDIVYVIGDFCLSHNKERIKELVSQLNGHLYLIMGNHDYLTVEDYLYAGFEKVYDETIIIDGFLILSHRPMFMTYNMPYFNIFGHVHNNPEYMDRTENSWCVSLERTNYFPVELDISDRPQKANIERDFESEFFHRMYADLVISQDEAKEINHKYLTLEEIFENAPKIKVRLSNAYQAESTKQYLDKILKQQTKASR